MIRACTGLFDNDMDMSETCSGCERLDLWIDSNFEVANLPAPPLTPPRWHGGLVACFSRIEVAIAAAAQPEQPA